MTKEQEEVIKECNEIIGNFKSATTELTKDIFPKKAQAIETVLNMLQEQQEENKKKDKIINDAITEVENIRQYFSEDLQPEFIEVLEILKDKKVIDW